MKITMTSTLLLILPSLLSLACGTSNGEESSSSATVAALPVKTLEPELSAEVRERADFDSGVAAQGEALLQPVPPELQRELEAGYQASLKQRHLEAAVPGQHQSNEQASVDFEELLGRIRNSSNSTRQILVGEYVVATEQISDPNRRAELLDRLSSEDPSNAR